MLQEDDLHVFNIYHVIPLPVTMNNTQWFIESTTDYIAIDLKGNKYYALLTGEMEKCTELSEETFMCPQEKPIEEGYSRAHECESKLILAKTLPSSCSISLSHPRDMWYQLARAGTWLFSVTSKSEATIVCKNERIERVTISHTGVMSLDKGCTFRSENITLTSYEEPVTNIELGDQPQINLTTIERQINSSGIQLKGVTKRLSGLHFHQTINSLAARINDLKTQQIDLKGLQPHDIHQYSVGYIALISIAVV